MSSTVLTKCLECKLWENSPYIVRQLPGIGPALASLLVAAGKTTFRKIVDANPRDLERVSTIKDMMSVSYTHLNKAANLQCTFHRTNTGKRRSAPKSLMDPQHLAEGSFPKDEKSVYESFLCKHVRLHRCV